MDAKKRFLTAYRENALEIERLTKEIEKWNERMTLNSEVVRLLHILNERIEKAMLQRDEIEQAIAALDDAKLRAVMSLRYLEGMKWEEIEDALHLEYRWLLRLHNRALQQICAE